MALHLQDQLETIRTTLQTDTSTTVEIRDSLPVDGDGVVTYPTGTHVIIDLIPGAPANDFGGTIYEDLILQVGAYSPASLTAAIALAETCRSTLEGLNYVRTGGVQFNRDQQYRGVVATYTLEAAFYQLT